MASPPPCPEWAAARELGEETRAAIQEKMRRGPNLVVRMLGDGALGCCSCDMDGALWSKLPWEIVLKVVLFLPRISQLRVRAVCKEWCELLSVVQPSGSGPLLCAYRVQGEEQQAVPRRTVCTMNLWRGFPHYGDSYFRQALSHSRLDVDKHSLTAQDGVLCILVRTDVDAYWDNPRRREIRDVFFVNPMTSTWRRMVKTGWPDLYGYNLWDKVEVGRAKFDLVKDSSSKDPSAKLLYGCSLRDSTYQGWITCLYSDTHNWENTERSLSPVRLMDERLWFDPVKENSVICDGVLYAYDAKDHRVFVHHFERDICEWHAALVPGASHTRRFYLLERQGRVLFAGLFCHGGNLGYRICRLKEDVVWSWEPLAVMPDHVMSQVRGCFQEEEWNWDMFEACAAGNCIFFMFRSSTMVQFAGFDMERKQWQLGFPGEDPRELATYDGFFEARMDLYLYTGPSDGRKGVYAPFGYESGAGYVFDHHGPCS